MSEQLFELDKNSSICPLRLVMDIVGGKWKLSILCLLKSGKPMRYNQIKRGIDGITNAMLAQCLKSFEEYGIVYREQYNEVPVRVEYRLAPPGLDLLEALRVLDNWGNQYIVKHTCFDSRCHTCVYSDKNLLR